MKKLSLQIDQLRVESFPTQGEPGARGTVAAHLGTVVGCDTHPAYGCTVMRAHPCASGCTEDPEICPAS